MKTYARIGLLVGVGFILMCFGTLAAVLWEKTLIEWWVVPSGALAVGFGTAFFAGQKWSVLTTTSNRPLNRTVHALATTVVLTCCVIGANYLWTKEDSAVGVETVVESKVRKEHQRTRRVGRHRYVNAGVWYSYHLDVRMPDGRLKTIEVSRGEYSRSREGNVKKLTLQQGLLGIPVIKKVDNPAED